MRSSVLSDEQAVEVIESDAFGPLAAELRRAEANHHDLAVMLPVLMRVRDVGDADYIAGIGITSRQLVLPELVAHAECRDSLPVSYQKRWVG